MALNPFTRYLVPLLKYPVWMSVIQVVLVAVILILLNQTVEHYALTTSLCNFPLVFFLLPLACFVPLYFQLSAALASLLCMSACRQLFDCYQANDCNTQTFNVFLLISVASLLVPPLLWMIPVLWIIYNIVNKLNLSRFLSSVAGIALVAWMVWSILFLMDKTSLIVEFSDQLLNGFTTDGFSRLTGLFSDVIWWQIGLGMYVLVALTAFFLFFRKEGRRRSVKNYTILLHFIWWCLMLLMVCYPVYSMQLLWLSLVPFSVSAGQLYFERDTLFTRILFVVFVAALLTSFISQLPL